VSGHCGPSGTRIVDRCEALATCSEEPAALTRVYLSPEQREAGELVLAWMREAGMTGRLDDIGNVVGRYEGTTPQAPCLMLGSHLDTVRDAGKYDGMLGVVAAIDCVHALNARGARFPFAVEVVGFADEEGVRFGSTLLGSRALAGTLDPGMLESRDAAGVSMREALSRFGLDPEKVGCAARRRGDVLAYAELHIEQGPALETEGLPVGVVTEISGASRYAVDIEGLAGHAGTVPMHLRRDALAAAAECVLAVESRCGQVPGLVGTVGRIEAAPGATNVIPGMVRFTIDLRASRDEDRRAAAADVEAAIASICERRKVTVRLRKTHDGRTAACAGWLQDQIGEAIAAEGLPVRRLPSGAGHDGVAIAGLADIGMLFVRCAGGISHNPLEAITVEDAAVSARVFLRFIERFRPAPADSRR
jgi:allantoate deiminase